MSADEEAVALSADSDREANEVQQEAGTSGGAPQGFQEDEQRKKKLLSGKKLKRLQDSYNRRGVVYISRIPPHLKPQKMRHMLSQYGEVTRVYLAPEDPALRKRRKQRGGNTGKNFSEGWVEFEDKSVAKQVAEMLNGKQMGGKRRSAYHYDLWCIKYLAKFKWDHLTEEIAYQNAVREQKLATEISAAKRERDFYMSRVDKAKAITAKEERKRKRLEKEGDAAEGSGPQPAAAAAAEPRIMRAYGQRKAKLDPVTDDQAPMLSADVLSLIAGKKAKFQ
ncbi:hypothetical protein WJX72_004286 [[Myrmecia] bisecta]|uniref:RRM domain-containing protein n=1 Tax=[Myrmecia] bisecta TaxID=41462 RepID=A0AAW1Q7P0_9CHLO